MKLTKLLPILITVLLPFSTVASSLNNIKTFLSDDYKKIVNSNNKPFIMLFWSIDCPPCIKEMKLISKLSNKQRKNYVFISTDGDDLKKEVKDTLLEINLFAGNNWVFDSNSSRQIISAIDSSWYGETPRSYYFDSDKNRTRLENPLHHP